MKSFKFKDKIAGKEYNLPTSIVDADGVEVNLKVLIGHIITYSKVKFKPRSCEHFSK